METAGYISLGRQSGLMREMQTVANNLANMSTGGYRAERVVYSEFIGDRGTTSASFSLGHGNVRASDFAQGALRQTGGALDVAIEGEGFFRLSTPDGGEVLSRQSSYSLSPDGSVVDATGSRLLDEGGAPIVIPTGAGAPSIGPDGTISILGAPLAKIGVWSVGSPSSMTRIDGVRFTAPDDVTPADARVMQGFVEASNVDPVRQISRMIEVQRAYELMQSLMERDDERIRGTIREIGK